MPYQLQLQTFSFANDTVELYVPNAENVQQAYVEQLKSNPSIASPYWSQIWPASIALAQFLSQNNFYIKDKQVLELAAGLGLPSLVAAKYATTVVCSDYIVDAVTVMHQSIQHLNLKNVESCLIDWNCLPNNLEVDVLLLSDINYEPAAFATLLQVLQHFINQNTTILLSTPQRIMAKPFVEQVLPWCVLQEDIAIQQNNQTIITTVFVLQHKK